LFKSGALGFVVKHPSAQGLAIERAIRVDNRLAKGLTNCRQPLSSGGHYGASDFVGIDNSNPARFKPIGDGGFAGRNTAG